MAEPSKLLQRWHTLSRADRKAILARLTETQHGDLMAMLAAGREPDRAGPGEAPADGWGLFSSRIAQTLRAIEAQPDGQPAPCRLTPAAAALLLDTARTMRSEQPGAEGWAAALGRRSRQWLKALDL